VFARVINPGARLPMVRKVSLVGLVSRNRDFPAGTST
jgi:hypothetical protein